MDAHQEPPAKRPGMPATKALVDLTPEHTTAEGRLTHGFCNEDMWSFDRYLFGVFANGLQEYADHVAEAYVVEDEARREAMRALAQEFLYLKEDFVGGEEYVARYEAAMKAFQEFLPGLWW